MAFKQITLREFDRIKEDKECPCCGAGEKNFKKLFADIDQMSCSLCGCTVQQHPYPSASNNFYIRTEKEFVKSKEEALAYYDADPLHILAYSRMGHFVKRSCIENNECEYIIDKTTSINDVAYIKPYKLYKAKHLLNEDNIDCTEEDDAICPYCGHEESDSWEYDEGENDEVKKIYQC
jgi:hypothetical protein